MNNEKEKHIETLLKDFYNLTNIKICVYDGFMKEVAFYPEKYSPFCKKLREDPKMNEKCMECDRLAFMKCRTTHSQYSYTCHAGLFECVSPIMYNSSPIGYIALGQVRTDSSVLEGSITDPELTGLFNSLPIESLSKIDSAIHVLDACTGYEYLKGMIKDEGQNIDSRIDEYIENNLSEDIGISDLSLQFHVSKNELYEIFKEYFSSTPYEYIINKRLDKAISLLLNSEYKVKDIAEMVGVPDYNYFSKVFKKKYGKSPRDIRN